MRQFYRLFLASALVASSASATEIVEKITFVNKLIDGKKTWTPTEQAVKGEGKIEITLINELEDPHGFSIPGLTDAMIIKGKETKTFTVTAPKSGEYKFHCQMHPAHVGGILTVRNVTN